MDRRVRIALMVLIGLAALWFIWRVRRLITPLLLAAILAYLLLPLVKLLETRKVPRSLAILLLYTFFGALGGIILSFLVPYLSIEIESLIATLPEQTARLEGLTLDWLRELRTIGNLPDTVREGVEAVVSQVEQVLATTVSRIVRIVMTVFTSVFYLILAPILAYFIMRDWPTMQKSFIGLFPPKYHQSILVLGKRIDRVLSGFIRGQLFISLIIGLMIAGGLALLGVRYALIVGLIGGAFNVVPYFGPIIGAIPAVVLALIESPTTALWTIVLFIAINQLESAILSPKIVGDMVGLHPLTVILAILAGAEVMGVAGMLLAVPLTAILKVGGETFMDWMVQKG